ncbi:transcriptional regulator family: Fungal Specific TF [Aspergillus niger]|nr:transcriptional regulator family: Fungal Specific TF [Aspergillus niger]
MNGIRKGITRRRGACEPCKARKTRCDGGNPCMHCRRKDSSCTYLRGPASTRSISTPSQLSPALSLFERDADLSLRQSISPQEWLETVAPGALDLPCWDLPDISCNPCPDWSAEGSMPGGQSESESSPATLPPHYGDPSVTRSDHEHGGDRTFSVHMLQKEFQTRQVTLGFDIPSLYSSLPMVESDPPRAENIKRAVELLNCDIVGVDKTCYILPDCHKPSMGPMLDSEPRISSYIQACFESPSAGVNMFLSMASAQECVDAVLRSDCSNRATVVVAYAVLALGCYLVSIQSGIRSAVEGITRATGYFRRALSELNCLSMDNATVRGLQGILIMVIFADKSAHHSKSRLVSLGVQCVQDLGLHSSRRLRQLSTGTDEERLLKNAFWALHAIEKADAVGTGRGSIMCDKHTDHSPSDALQHPDEARLTLQCLYGRLCDRVIDSLFSQAALRVTRADMCRQIEDAYCLVQAWLGIFQTYNNSLNTPAGRFSCLGEQAEAETHLSSYFLIFLIHGKWLHLAQQGLDPEEAEAYERSETRCLAAARSVLEQCSQQTHVQMLANMRFRSLPKIAACILILTGQSCDRSDEQKMYLNMASQVCIFGVIAALQIFIRNKTGFLLTRSILGLSEAGYIPAAMYTLSTWYTREELTKRIAVFFFGMFGGAAVSPLLGAALLKLDGKGELHGWQWIFLLEGIWSVLMAIALFTLLPERESITAENSDEESAGKCQSWNGPTSKTLPVKVVWQTLTNYTKWPHFLATACVFATWSPLTTYTPTIIMSLGFSRIQANALAAIGSLLTLPVIVFFACLSDWSRRRGMSVMLAIAVYLVSLILLRVLQARVDRWGRFGLWTTVNGLAVGYHPVHNAWIQVNCSNPGERSVSVAMFVMSATAGLMAGTQIFRHDDGLNG